MRVLRLRRPLSSLLLFVVLAFAFVSAPEAAQAQDAYVTGKLHIGFSDQENPAGLLSNRAVPVCAGAGEQVNPGVGVTTQGTLLVNARAQAAPGVGGTITFHAVSTSQGGAQQKRTETCRWTLPDFAAPVIRSLSRIDSAHFPARKGPYTSMIATASVPTTPTATYRLSAGGGETAAATITNWTTMSTTAASAMTFTGAAFEVTHPGYFAGTVSNLSATHRFQPGAARFGGGVPYSGEGWTQIGIHFLTGSCPQFCGTSPIPFGFRLYANGRIPNGPRFFGSNARTADLSFLTTTNMAPPVFSDGLLVGRARTTYAARTPGGTTKNQQGAIRTLGGGNTATPAAFPGPPIVSRIAVQGLYHGWTTGAVTHVNRGGSVTTIRKAAGFDVAVASSSAIAGETRRIQVVSPWSAAVRLIGPFGLPAVEPNVGGVAVLALNVIPAPEPGFAAAIGVAVVVLSRRARKRRRSSAP